MSYKKSKYFSTSKKIKIKYLYSNKKSQICIVFFHGFMSDMMGKKPLAIEKFCKKRKLSFLKFEYSGHGKSTGKFTQGNITKWTSQAKRLIRSKIKINKNLIFIGSSMGSWIALNLIMSFEKQIKGFIGIASAPEFLEELMWKKFTKKIKKILLTKKIYHLNHGEFTYPLTKQLIFDGRKNKILNKKINLKIPIILLHGINDDHSLSKKNDLKKICRELDHMISNHI